MQLSQQSRFHDIWAVVCDGCVENIGQDGGVVKYLNDLRKESHAACNDAGEFINVVQKTYETISEKLQPTVCYDGFF